ncbi:hypothetical protein [Klebsiella aerogenes]|uniref:hypothetical protein n=1 Tax=Klebsiella aerogenes TaxID=548 RepID=UPI0013A60111|nr:hypothetical protein [Klebsiella aerogenes]HCB2859829.1 hypothetical protein [Klebsiella aerogenes]HCB2864832.1 hypothetical protein [Klebsiella aerogenes]HCB2880496.1 hypothetical protein [Klebsiella aerogenes]HCB3345895.1 hypothetical protein [Klebsiella aerogenes]HCM1811897.1 hypothetical protein [Klebsiella aerogenes]
MAKITVTNSLIIGIGVSFRIHSLRVTPSPSITGTPTGILSSPPSLSPDNKSEEQSNITQAQPRHYLFGRKPSPTLVKI